MSCLYTGLCSGCDFLHLNRSQVETKRTEELERFGIPVRQLGHRFGTVWIDDGGLRDRVEFVVERSMPTGRLQMGLYAKAKTEVARHSKQLVEIAGCSQFSPALERFYQDFAADLPPIALRGSVRLRVSPYGDRGVWLDFSNEDIRDVLNDEEWLARASDRGWIIEMGQRRKRVVIASDGRRFRLADPILTPWFQTWVNDQPQDLFGTIGTFTQPGLKANRSLVQAVIDLIPKGESTRQLAVEFGCGIGNFTIPLASLFQKVVVYETDRLALQGLTRGLEAANRQEHVEIHTGDFIRGSQHVDIGTPNLILVDPPRSGLGNFLEILKNPAARSANWIYVSCFPESLGRDLVVLQNAGLRIDAVTIVEQFPFTRHYEVVVALKCPPEV